MALGLMLAPRFGMGADKGAAVIQRMLLNMAGAGAMLSYLLQAVNFIVLRLRRRHLPRPYHAPFGFAGAGLTIVLAAVTVAFQLLDPVFVSGVLGVGAWFALGIAWFAVVGRHGSCWPPAAFASSAGERGHRSSAPRAGAPAGRAPSSS